MNRFGKNIISILAVILVALVVYPILLLGIVNNSPDKHKNTAGDDITTEFELGNKENPASKQPVEPEDGLETQAKSDKVGAEEKQTKESGEGLETQAESKSEGSQENTFTDDGELSEDKIEIATDGDAKAEKELPDSASIELEIIYQHPELPTGCESVALTMALNYYGFELEKTTIAKDYLIYSNNFAEGYMGDPFSTGGAGIYAPGLTKSANRFLSDKKSEYSALNVTGSTPEELYGYIAQGKPVVVWNTVYFLQNQPTGLTAKCGMNTYEWDRCEHCVVLSGYDLNNGVVTVYDPVEGIMERDADGFWERYENLGSMAMIIREPGE